MTSFSLDLTRRAFVRERGHLAFIGSWIRDHGEERYEPALVIVRAGEEMRDGTVPCVIPLTHAWMWDPSIGDMIRAADALGQFMVVLRMDFDERSAVRMVNNIHDMLADLLLMPMNPPGVTPEIVAEFIVTGEDGSEREIQVKHWS